MKTRFAKAFTVALLASTIALLPVLLIGQTRIAMPKNKYKVQDDVKLGNDAARQVTQQFPLVNDAAAQRYIESVGQRLVAAIPAEFQQPAFDYRFKIVNASDINAFALPGGPMFVNRGMIEAAKNEGEMAGVMAHEMSHVALRHATAQQTKVNNPLNQILGIGAILGGAVLGGEAGAQAGQVFAAGYFLKFSREYEKQADILGARIMANAGYDPRDLANMFRTIEQQAGERGAPEWLSSHPNPGNRFQYINQEATALQVSPNPIKITQGFSRTQEKLRGMPLARSMSQIQQSIQQGQSPGNTSQTAGGRYSNSVQLPSTRTRSFSNNLIQMEVPDNWRDFPMVTSVQFAPEGGYGDQGITHGVLVGVDTSTASNTLQATQNYVTSVVQGNSYLRQQGSYTRFNLSGRQGYTTTLSGISPITNRIESVAVYTAMLSNGQLLFVTTVAPQSESYRYSNAFRNLLASIHVND
ncbi:MAG: M48 family metallopeptidase [Acidobacteriota bacterium]